MKNASPNALRLALALLAALGAAACGDDDGGGSGGGGGGGGGDGGVTLTPEMRLALVSDLARNVLVPTYEEFLTTATALETAAAAYAADTSSTANRDALRAAYDAAIAAWQRAEVMQVGPAGSSTDAIGGQNLRDLIYSWPTVDRCRVDQELVAAPTNYSDVDAFANVLVTARGFDALEYLLYREDPGHSCAAAPAGWPPADLVQRRADYALTVATLIRRHAQALVDAWSPTGGNFLAQIETAGSGGSAYPSAQVAMNQVTNAMFYVELEVKDLKVAVPAGISDLCPDVSCPESVEAPWSDASLDHIAQNLVGFERLYFGGAPAEGVDGGAPTTGGNGFDDLLRTLGQADLAMRMESALAGAAAATTTVPAPLETAVVDSPAVVASYYESIRALTTLIKTEFLAVLDLERPPVASADTD